MPHAVKNAGTKRNTIGQNSQNAHDSIGAHTDQRSLRRAPASDIPGTQRERKREQRSKRDTSAETDNNMSCAIMHRPTAARSDQKRRDTKPTTGTLRWLVIDPMTVKGHLVT